MNILKAKKDKQLKRRKQVPKRLPGFAMSDSDNNQSNEIKKKNGKKKKKYSHVQLDLSGNDLYDSEEFKNILAADNVNNKNNNSNHKNNNNSNHKNKLSVKTSDNSDKAMQDSAILSSDDLVCVDLFQTPGGPCGGDVSVGTDGGAVCDKSKSKNEKAKTKKNGGNKKGRPKKNYQK